MESEAPITDSNRIFFGCVGGRRGERSLHTPLRDADEGVREFDTSAALVGVTYS